jgi:hypothetical protein
MFALTTNQTTLLVAALSFVGVVLTGAMTGVAAVIATRNRRDVIAINNAVNNIAPGQPNLYDSNAEQLAVVKRLEQKFNDHLSWSAEESERQRQINEEQKATQMEVARLQGVIEDRGQIVNVLLQHFTSVKQGES